MSVRGQKFTALWRQVIYYSDFLSEFTTNPTTGALGIVTNEDAISTSIRNLVMTSPGERPGRSAIGSKVMGSLFDIGSPVALDALETSILEVIQNYEPRATSVQVKIDRNNIQDNSIFVTVSYRPINLPQVVTTSFTLQRVR